MSTAAAVAEAWPRACARWSRFLLLSEPVDADDQPTVAWIDLSTRQVALNHAYVESLGLTGSVEALLAHEIGHHVRFPGSLAVQARLRILERGLIPFEEYTATNLFADLLINVHLGRDPALREQLAAVYRAFTRKPGYAPAGEDAGQWGLDPAFAFYLTIYEACWELPSGDLVGPAYPAFAAAFPGHRAEARLMAQDLFALGPNLYTQFLYFLSVLIRYVKPRAGDEPQALDPHRCQHAQPTAEDWADALLPDPRERAAIERAIREGWITGQLADELARMRELEGRLGGLPGFHGFDATLVPEVMAAWYRRQAERYLVAPPPQPRVGEAVVPTEPEDWSPGDAVRDIDWLTTLLERGEVYGAAQPLRRTRIAEQEGHDVRLWQPRVEIYLDVSGSMPDPRFTVNAMTLAAQILVTGATRSGGRARGLVYSQAPVQFWEWTRSAQEMSRFLMHYIGGGTAFPFDVLAASVAECGRDQPVRVVITDADFDHNHAARPEHAEILADAARQSDRLVLLLHCANPDAVRRYRAAGATVVEVPQMDDFPRMAAGLARALFPEEGRGIPG